MGVDFVIIIYIGRKAGEKCMHISLVRFWNSSSYQSRARRHPLMSIFDGVDTRSTWPDRKVLVSMSFGYSTKCYLLQVTHTKSCEKLFVLMRGHNSTRDPWHINMPPIDSPPRSKTGLPTNTLLLFCPVMKPASSISHLGLWEILCVFEEDLLPSNTNATSRRR